MIKNLFRDYIYPIAVFSGGMIGVGFLSLPYVAMQAGIWVTLFYFLITTAIIVLVHLVFCEISLKTPDFKRFPGFAGHYLGKKAKFLALFLSIFGTIAVLLAYLIIAGEFLTSAFHPFFAVSSLVYVLIYFLIVSTVIFFDINLVAKIEFWVLVFLFLSFVMIFLKGFPQISLQNVLVGNKFRWSNFFLPYGPLLFALWGTGLIPETEEMLRGKKHNLKKIVVISTILISVFYFLFTILILSISGSQTSFSALTGLKNILGNGVVFLALLMGVLASFTAFIAQGIIFKKTLIFDLKIKHWQAFIITCFPPMILFLLGLKSFIPILSFTGAVLLGIDGILILLMYKKIGGKKWVIYFLSIIFILGTIFELILNT